MRRLFVLPTLALLTACLSADASPERSTRDHELASAAGDQQLPPVVVYKAATCGCCKGWVEHMRAAGFVVEARDLPTNVELMRVKADAGVPDEMVTCHTALIDGYVVEGHVPADQVKRLLADRPAIVGIATPGMPIGSPGMEGPNPQPYEVLAWTRDGHRSTFAEIAPR